MPRPKPAEDFAAPVSAEYRRIVTAHRGQLNALRERAANAARAEVRHLFRLLRHRFPRHRFTLTQGMGSLSVASLREGGEGRFSRALFLRGELDRPGGRLAEAERNRYLAAILHVAEKLESDFGAEVGDLRSA